MQDNEKRIAEFKIPSIDSLKWGIIQTIKVYLMKISPNEAETLVETFTKKYESLLQAHDQEYKTDLSRFYRLVMEFKPALASVMQPGKEFDEICDIAVMQFNVTLDRIRRQINEEKGSIQQKGPVLPGSNPKINLKYFCTVCKQEFEIPPDVKTKLLNSSEKMELPKHHDREMEIRIKRPPKEEPIMKSESEEKKIEIYSAELLMGHLDSAESKVEYLNILSVGIDVGSSTSHLVFSRLTLRRETSLFNMSNRFILVNRELIYEGNIILTPLIDRYTIDIEAIIKFCEEEYEKAGITPEMVDTGAVIVTGETAKKQNAAEIVRRLSSKSGKFVSASTGPNFESLLGAMGSGIVDLSREKQNTILNVDIGGGTSNLAISSRGNVLSTSCINVGGRLLGIDENFKIWRIDEPSEVVMKELNMNYMIGNIIPEEDVKTIAQEYAKALIEVMKGPATSNIAKKLILAEDLDFSIPIDAVSFSGGVAEMIFDKNDGKTYNDIGMYLAEEIMNLVSELNVPLIEPEYKIRATVIGAGAFSLSVSGSTCYYDENIKLPLENVPVVPVNMDMKEFSGNPKILKTEIDQALNNFDMKEGEDIYALYFKDLLNRRDLSVFAREIESALPNSAANEKMILIILRFDGGKILGITLKRETSIKNNIFCLDELELEAGDWIDIGAPLSSGEAFPITIKSLVFNKGDDSS